MSTLFEIVGDFQTLYAMATEPDTDPEAFEGSLEALTGELEVKGKDYVQVIKQLEMEQAQAEAISKQFKDKADVRKHSIERMKDRLLVAMNTIGKDKIEAGDWTIKVQNNGPCRLSFQLRAGMQEHPGCRGPSRRRWSFRIHESDFSLSVLLRS